MSKDAIYEKHVADLGQSYKVHLGEILHGLNVIDQSLTSERIEDSVVSELRDTAHKIAGSAGTFKFDAVAAAAEKTEIALVQFVETEPEKRTTEEFRVAITPLVDALKTTLKEK